MAVFKYFLDFITQNQELSTLAALGLIFWVYTLFKPKKKAGLATGYWAGKEEFSNAKIRAQKQQSDRKVYPVSLSIGKPKTLCLREQKEPNYKQPTYWFSDLNAVAVVGAPDAGKTYSVIDPLIRSAIDQGFPTLVYDYKFPTQTSRLYQYAIDAGYEVSILAPGFGLSEVCNILDFLKSPKDESSARQIAFTMNRNFDLNKNAPGADKFFGPSGDQLFSSVLMLAKSSFYPDIMMCKALLSLPDFGKRLAYAVQTETLDPWITSPFDQYLSTLSSPETTGGINATAQLLFQRFQSDEILTTMIGNSTIPVMLTGKKLLIIGVDRNIKDIVTPLLASVLERVLTSNFSTPRSEPLIAALDEISTIYYPDLASIANTNREGGLSLIMGLQNIVQLEITYGKDVARAIWGACSTKFIGSPRETETAKLVSELLGEEEIEIKQRSRGSSGGKGNQNTSDQNTKRPLLEPAALNKFPQGKFVVLNPGYQNQKEATVPFQIKIEISDCINQAFNRNQEARWPRIANRLDKHRLPIHTSEFKLRKLAAQELLPLPPENESSAKSKTIQPLSPEEARAELEKFGI
jgi:type IV secretory pathway TraG/TraD family ATPase VirD4